MRAIQIQQPGDASALRVVDIPKPVPRAGEKLVRVEAIGVNFLDVYHRTGLYKVPLPFVPGSEAAGVIEETGERVAWAMVPGAYAEYAAVPQEKLVPLPVSVASRLAAACLLQGMTAHYLVTSTYLLRPGNTAVVHAAAGGAGGMLVQMAKQRGARVVATASPEKHADVRALGADEVFDYDGSWSGVEADVVYDSVGRATFDRSIDALGIRGTLVLFGQSSGPVPAIDPARLAKKSLFLTRPTLAHYTRTADELLWRAQELFESIESGAVRVRIDRELPLAGAAEAHRLLESRGTRGKLLLVP
jgi:NADPH2:quinone reductase